MESLGNEKELQPEMQSEYIVLNDNAMDMEVPAVDWDSVELEYYEYFIGAQIFSSMCFSQKIQREAQELLADGRVKLESVTTGYYEQGEDTVGYCYGTGYVGEKDFPIYVCFHRTAVLRTDCQCPNCANLQHHFSISKRNDCPYTAALLMLLEEYLKGKNIADATNKTGMHFLYAFQQKYAAELSKGLKFSEEKFSLRPKLVEKNEQLNVSFKIEASKSFVIKD